MRAEPRLMERNRSRSKQGSLGRVGFTNPHPVAVGREACCGDESDVAGSDYCDLQLALLLVVDLATVV